MSVKRNDLPPSELQPHLKAISEAFMAITRGEDPEHHAEVVYRATDSAMREAWSLIPQGPVTWDTPAPASFAEIIGANIRALRDEAQWSKEQVAKAMERLGFAWKRLTVTEVEGAYRRLSLEELLAIAALFAVPAIKLLLPDARTALDWPLRALYPPVVHELFLGRGGTVGDGGVRWRAPVVALGGPTAKDDFRPAADLWRNRRSAGRPGVHRPEKESL
jgi:transcriptional regulator with XRE-family HTH domain